MSYLAGQFIQLYLPHASVDDRGDKRWFTLSSSPTEEHISITTRKSHEYSSSFKNNLFSLTVGSDVDMSAPMGDFVLPKDKDQELLFIAVGLGITPVRSIIKFLYDTGEKRSIQIIYGERTPQDIAFIDLLELYGTKLEVVLRTSTPGWSGPVGKIDYKLVSNLVPDLKSRLVYISGPEPFVETLESQSLENNINPANLILDFYPGYEH